MPQDLPSQENRRRRSRGHKARSPQPASSPSIRPSPVRPAQVTTMGVRAPSTAEAMRKLVTGSSHDSHQAVPASRDRGDPDRKAAGATSRLARSLGPRSNRRTRPPRDTGPVADRCTARRRPAATPHRTNRLRQAIPCLAVVPGRNASAPAWRDLYFATCQPGQGKQVRSQERGRPDHPGMTPSAWTMTGALAKEMLPRSRRGNPVCTRSETNET